MGETVRMTGVYVLDASVLIDLCHGDIAREAISQLEQTLAPDIVCAEVHDCSIEDLMALGLQQREYTSEEIVRLQTEKLRFPDLTHQDVAALLLACDKRAILLTGDKHMRKHAEEEQLEVHGILWILDRLVESRSLDRLSAADALERIQADGSWLPCTECKRRIGEWRS